jgi:DNA-binding transcriptional LysR family regulator
MTLDQLRYFLAAARFEHVAKAARSVSISPSAVSTAIASLEDEFACPLFRREGKRIALNDQGRYLRTEIEALFDRLSLVQKHLQGATTAVQGSYRLAASHFLATRYLARAWIGLQREHPRLEGELCSMATTLAVDEVLKGTLDLALCFSPLRHPELKHVELYQGQLRLAVRKGHPILRRGRVRLQDLSAYPATLHKAAPGVDVCEVHPMFEAFRIEPRIRCLFDSDDQAVESLVRTDSWALLPDVVIRTFGSRLRALAAPRGWNAPYQVSAVLRPHRSENQTMVLLIERLRALLAARGS